MGRITILIDNREQRPLEFKLESIRTTLNVGDYCARIEDGTVIPVVVERKGIGDLFGTLSKGYSRFKKEIERAKMQKIELIIAIEGTKEIVLKGYSHSKRNGCSIVLQLETIKERYAVDHKYFKSRKEMSTFIEELYTTKEKEHNERKEAGNAFNSNT